MVVQAVVGALAVVVHLLEVGLGHLVDFRQTAGISKQRRALQKEALYDHDNHSFPFQEEEYTFLEEGCVLLRKGRDDSAGCRGSAGCRCPSPRSWARQFG